MNKNNIGFTTVEVLISIIIVCLLSGIIYGFVGRAFQFSGGETKSIEAIQETALIYNYIKNDLKNIFENPYDSETHARFDDSAKSFEFYVVNGIAENNMQILSKIKYYFENNILYRKIETYVSAKKIFNSKIKLSNKNKIKDFNVKIYSENGELISNSSKQPPSAFINVNFTHSDNKRLSINSNIAIQQIPFTAAPLEKYRVESWKLKTIESGVLLAKINVGKIAFESVEYSRNAKFTQTRIGSNSGTPQTMQKPIVKKRAPFGGTQLNVPNPYIPPQPADAGSPLANKKTSPKTGIDFDQDFVDNGSNTTSTLNSTGTLDSSKMDMGAESGNVSER